MALRAACRLPFARLHQSTSARNPALLSPYPTVTVYQDISRTTASTIAATCARALQRVLSTATVLLAQRLAVRPSPSSRWTSGYTAQQCPTGAVAERRLAATSSSIVSERPADVSFLESGSCQPAQLTAEVDYVPPLQHRPDAAAAAVRGRDGRRPELVGRRLTPRVQSAMAHLYGSSPELQRVSFVRSIFQSTSKSLADKRHLMKPAVVPRAAAAARARRRSSKVALAACDAAGAPVGRLEGTFADFLERHAYQAALRDELAVVRHPAARRGAERRSTRGRRRRCHRLCTGLQRRGCHDYQCWLRRCTLSNTSSMASTSFSLRILGDEH